ncbi:oligoribonuclease [Buchnera aphidicola]|uniref:oligoribonuclease n=1 Tax=Buchnera aphidicola TaxID=9 RepID=UPI002238DFF7|nr:oligoribonuclease [Buchnera aphidicola]MCW5197444.1 oligoribonuclease [Buchnera aphidicola (Chaitophorus viminalis)]
MNIKNNHSKNLIWVDLEMTGLCYLTNRILEIAVIITDSNLNILQKGPVISIYQSKKILERMNSWNKRTHNKSGLIQKVVYSKYNEKKAETEILQFLKKWVPVNQSPICGSTVWKDREFLKKYMPKLESYFHYRNIDVSTIQELYSRWNKKSFKKSNQANKHSASYDVQESILELKYYKKNFFNIKNLKS